MKRRDFISQVAAISVLSAQQPQPADRFVGIQMGPHSLLDEGIDRCLDLIQVTAAAPGKVELGVSDVEKGEFRRTEFTQTY